tara:strand:- start:1202 stop:2215 length:1014 start_codon:yes stop_codon:yes gene_type:complete
VKKFIILLVFLVSCNNQKKIKNQVIIESIIQTEKVEKDIDDPAIWYNNDDPSRSLIIGTQKDIQGGLIVYNLKGEIDKSKSVYNLSRPNNVDVLNDVSVNGRLIDIAVTTERFKNSLRIFSLPEMTELDGGGLRVFKGDENPEPMGVSLWKDEEGNAHAVVGKKNGVSGEYLDQYKLIYNDKISAFELSYLRSFGKFSGKKEIEAITVDKEDHFIYYSDEGFGIRKYHADPKYGSDEILNFGNDFVGDHEGISIINKEKKYILVSDQQQVNQFRIFSDESDHLEIGSFYVNCIDSDGSEFHPGPFPEPFADGLFVAMSDDLSFHYYSWEQIKEYFNE